MKRQLVRLASTAFPQWIGRALAGRFLPIFMLHRYVDEKGEPREDQIRTLRMQLQYVRDRGYQPMRLLDIVQQFNREQTLPKRAVVFTVDDGFFDQAEILGPLFAEYDIPFTCFVITEFLDKKLWSWDDHMVYALRQSQKPVIQLTLPDNSQFLFDTSNFFNPQIRELRQALKAGDQTFIYDWLNHLYHATEVDKPDEIPPAYHPMTWEQAAKLIQMGHDIAPHTCSHRILSRLNDMDAEREILESWEVLQQRLPDSIPVFAYPTGRIEDFTPRDRDTVENSPMIGAVCTVPQAICMSDDPYALPRYGMPHDMTDFIQYLDWIEVVKNRFRRLFQ